MGSVRGDSLASWSRWPREAMCASNVSLQTPATPSTFLQDLFFSCFDYLCVDEGGGGAWVTLAHASIIVHLLLPNSSPLPSPQFIYCHNSKSLMSRSVSIITLLPQSLFAELLYCESRFRTTRCEQKSQALSGVSPSHTIITRQTKHTVHKLSRQIRYLLQSITHSQNDLCSLSRCMHV